MQKRGGGESLLEVVGSLLDSVYVGAKEKRPHTVVEDSL